MPMSKRFNIVHGTGGQLGAQGSNNELQETDKERFSDDFIQSINSDNLTDIEDSADLTDMDDSDDLTEIDESDEELIEISQETFKTLSERAKKTLKQTSSLAQSYFSSVSPLLLRMQKCSKKIPFSIELQTFSRSNNIIVISDSGKKVLCLIQFHPLAGADSVCDQLSRLIEDLHVMASHQSNLRNKKNLSGRISGIGFRGGYEKGKSAGTYALRKDLKPSQIELDRILQEKLPSHNRFISHRFRHFSQAAYDSNSKALEEFGLPSWSNKAWESYNNEPTPLCSNVIVTSNDFSNKAHCDKDKNVFTYGIFSYID
ncbi:Ubiquitin carboxyl-terminal hydrolase 7 [Puccinia graminis f. sp. tritici]|uniref:Ubiquitin carboxyl-terminal hydrolase 7 n=1 Tax=Puccinia graminis f. sp. tritici TaxID=56615 RepID=A0A5B0MI19_PUCGR|nr:Ubiquitin carboxyl-terminal hydrolase 7 [Puccinia graminis f. sp. tritici]